MNNLDLRCPDVLAGNAVKNPRFCVAVVGGTNSVGTSYVAGQIAKNGLLSGNTPAGKKTLIELGKPYFYSALGMEKRFMGREFSDFPKGIDYSENMEMGINWYLLKPDSEALKDAEIFRAVYTTPGQFIVFDCSGLQNSPIIFDILSEMNLIYLVVDPLPSKLIEGLNFCECLIAKFPKTELVINKFAKGIHRQELASFLGTSNYLTLDARPVSDFYKAEYNCILP